MRHVCIASLVGLGLLAGCGPTKSESQPPPPAKIHTSYRVISGLSMGAVGSAAVGLSQPERFDAIVPLGGPLDAAVVLRLIDQMKLGGFCSLSELEALAAQSPEKLNDPKAIAACSKRAPTLPHELSQDFNHWAWTIGGGFDRTRNVDLFHDLGLAFGNILTENPESTFAPPGVDPERVRHPPADFCTNPVRVKGLRNLEYNPEGKYDAITFCDGSRPLYYCTATKEPVDFCSDPKNVASPLSPSEEQPFAAAYCATKGGYDIASAKNEPLLMLAHGADFDPCRQTFKPITVGLAIDLNGNGRRDYGEPVVNNGQERFDDVGTDGCDDAHEDGHGGCITTTTSPGAGASDPNHDDYEAVENPFGTEQNWVHDDGEPFRDDGLDGVPGTSDFGEGNGAFDMTRGRKRLFAQDARSRMRDLSPDALARLHFLLDGGVRDLFDFGIGARQVFGSVKALHPQGGEAYRDFSEIPGLTTSTGSYQPFRGQWSKVPPNLFVFYGKDDPTDAELIAGEGDHVGTMEQAIDRIYTLASFAGAQWPSLPKPKAPFGGMSTSERQSITSFDSKALGAKREFGIFLPPGYDAAENADTRYPVLYMLHGYGMEPNGFLPSVLLLDSAMTGANPELRPMIIVFPSGECCFHNATTGARDCREHDDPGAEIAKLPGWQRECADGSFYVNAADGSSAQYQDSFFELMDYVDQNYRTLPAAEVEQR